MAIKTMKSDYIQIVLWQCNQKDEMTIREIKYKELR